MKLYFSKSLAILAISTMLGMPAIAQVYKFKAFETCIDKSNGEKTLKESDFTEQDILVVINLDKNKIKTYANKVGDYDLVNRYKEVVDEDGNKVLQYDAVNGNGEDCMIYITLFHEKENKHIATMRVKYVDMALVFRLKKDE